MPLAITDADLAGIARRLQAAAKPATQNGDTSRADALNNLAPQFQPARERREPAFR